jgi:hypothetical protein
MYTAADAIVIMIGAHMRLNNQANKRDRNHRA